MHLLARIRQRSPTRRSRLEKFCNLLTAGRSVSSYLCTVRAPPGVTPSLLRNILFTRRNAIPELAMPVVDGY